MQSNKDGYHYSGLIAVLGLLALLAGLIVMILLPIIRLAAWGIMALGVVLLATAFIIDFRRVSSAITGRRGRLGAGTTVMASIFIGIVILANAISIGNYHRFDFTGAAQFTLTQQTKDALSQLETPVQALFFTTPQDPYGIGSYITSLLTEYQNYTDQLSLKSIDPDEYPDQARRYGITQYQTVVFESQNYRRLVLPTDLAVVQEQQIVGLDAEHAFTSAILEVTGTVQKKVYFLTGHGEANINSDYSAVRDGLRDNLYLVGMLDLIATPAIPQDCTALIIAGPQKSLNSGEFDIIKCYLDYGGWVMLLANPNPPQDITQLLSPWGIDIEDGIVIDPSSYLAPNKNSPSVSRDRNFFGLTVTYFPESSAITPQGKVPENINVEPLVWTSKDSWAEKSFDPNQEPVFDEGVDLNGPLALGILMYTSLPSDESGATLPLMPDTRLVVFGDSDFASNQHFYNGNNGELFLNSVNLLTEGKELISIERKVLPFRRLVIGPEETNIIRYTSIGLLPLLVLIVGGVIWWQRR